MMSTVVSLVCVILNLGWGGAGMAQARPPEIVMDPSAVEATAASDKGQANRADAERRQPGLTSLLVPLPMVSIPGGSFRMGCTSEQRNCADDEYPVHEVQVDDFEIGQYEVTQEVWEAVMSEHPRQEMLPRLAILEKPRDFRNCAQCPVAVSWEDVQLFLDQLNAWTGGEYRLPTEAEWEYAARGGRKSRGYEYAGSDTPGVVAWYESNSPGHHSGSREVGQKVPNELGLYDMSGNVAEWVEDCWHDSYYMGAPTDGRAWASENSGDCSRRVRRGGSRFNAPRSLRVAYRDRRTTGNRDSYYGFRLARTLTPVEATAAPDTGHTDRADAERQAVLTPLLVRFKMVFVPGGSFRMGCTREQRACWDDEQPVHEVQVNDFEMGQYEVTQELWEAVMGENPSWFTDCAQCPVELVSWADVQRFLDELNALTGGGYRLPTEAEWEYAARGGQQSQGYQFGGSEDPGRVVWVMTSWPHPVGQKQPNELGLYDMSGNASEWVEDCWHDSYTGAPADGRAWVSGDCSKRVLRGGSWFYFPRYLRAASRSGFPPGVRGTDFGVRLARTLTP